MPMVARWFITFGFILVIGALAYWITYKIFTIPGYAENIEKLKDLIHRQKKCLYKQNKDEAIYHFKDKLNEDLGK